MEEKILVNVTADERSRTRQDFMGITAHWLAIKRTLARIYFELIVLKSFEASRTINIHAVLSSVQERMPDSA